MIDRNYTPLVDDYDRRGNWDWLPLLLIPLFLVLGYLGWQAYKNRATAYNTTPASSTSSQNKTSNGQPQTGIGGGPNVTVTVKPSASPTAQPSVSPSPTVSVTPTAQNAQQGIGGSGSYASPTYAPNTGGGGTAK